MKKVFIPLFLLISIFTVSTSQAQMMAPTPPVHKITVTGSAEMEIDPDEIFVNFTLREYQNNRKEKIGIESIRKDFLAACSKAGIAKENIRVEGAAGNAYGDWFIRKRKKDPDFVANITYVIKFSSTKLIDELVPLLNDDAVLNMYISKKSHSNIENFRKEVKIKAAMTAKEKARYLAEAVGEKTGKALLIEEIDSDNPMMPMMMKMSNAAFDGREEMPYGGDTSMPFEKIKIRYEVRAEFELL